MPDPILRPEIYESGARIPLFDGTITGGITVVVHTTNDLEGLQALCQVVGTPPDNPMHAMHGVLSKAQMDGLDLNAWMAWRTRLGLSAVHWSQSSDLRALLDEAHGANEAADASADRELLLYALSLAYDLWSKDEAKNAIALALTVPDPRSVDGRLTVASENAALMLHRGSLRLSFARSLVAVGFCVMFFQGRGLAPSISGQNLFEALRDKANTAKKKCVELQRLDRMPRHELHDPRAVVIFVHGLFSTDLGLFDALIQAMNAHHALGQEVVKVGWPHDTLASITDNGRDLADDIFHAFGVDSTNRVAFVCHSRGGLVARDAAVRLFAKTEENWRARLVGCVTFGTPHEGAALAEIPGDVVGLLLAGQALRSTGTYASVSDALWYCNRRKDIVGIVDIQPPTGGGKFMAELKDRERAQADPGLERNLRILAVGGAAGESARQPWRWLTKHVFGNFEHDLVVETSSSTPRRFQEKARTNCNHFSYFDDTRRPDYDQVLAFLREVFREPVEPRLTRLKEVLDALQYEQQSADKIEQARQLVKSLSADNHSSDVDSILNEYKQKLRPSTFRSVSGHK